MLLQIHFFIKWNLAYRKHFVLFLKWVQVVKVFQVFKWVNVLVLDKEQQKTCKAMKSSQKYLLAKLIHVDEFTVGRKEEGKHRDKLWHKKKKKAVIAVELTDNNKVKRVYIKSIKDYSTKSLIPIFKERISVSAKIVADK